MTPTRPPPRWRDSSKAISPTVMTLGSDATHVVCLRGTPVSPGLARGPLVLMAESVRPVARTHGSAAEETSRLRAAIAAASAELAGLMERADDTEAEAILAFQ